ncbi:hypothetical protein D3C76_1155420 [compost metagenome]
MGGIQYSRNVLVNPSGSYRVTADNDYNCIRVRCIDSLDQSLLLLWKHNIRSVDFFFSVKEWMVAHKNHSDFSRLGSFYCSLYAVSYDVLFEKTCLRIGILICHLQRSIFRIHRDHFIIPGPQRYRIFAFRNDVNRFFYKPAVNFLSRCCKSLCFA